MMAVFNRCLSSSSYSSAIHEVKILTTYLEMIKKGQKRCEGRINRGRFCEIKAGDWIKFIANENPSLFIYCKVLKKSLYPDFRSMLEAEGVEPCLPDVKAIEQAEALYLSFPGYQDGIKRYGVVAFNIEHDKKQVI